MSVIDCRAIDYLFLFKYSVNEFEPNLRRLANMEAQIAFPSTSVISPLSNASIKISPVVTTNGVKPLV